jgi:hypothetical protein
LEMVDNFISPCERTSGRFSPHSTVQVGYFILYAHAPVPAFTFASRLQPFHSASSHLIHAHIVKHGTERHIPRLGVVRLCFSSLFPDTPSNPTLAPKHMPNMMHLNVSPKLCMPLSMIISVGATTAVISPIIKLASR